MQERTESRRKYYFRIVLNIIIPIVLAVLLCTVGVAAVRFFLPFMIGWVIALIAGPVVRLLDQKVRIWRSFSSIAIIVLVIGGIMAIMWGLSAWLFRQVVDLSDNLPGVETAMKDAAALLEDRIAGMLAALPGNIHFSFRELGNSAIEYLSKYLGNIGQPAMEMAGDFLSSIPNAIVYVIVTILSAYFFLTDKEELTKKLYDVLPESVHHTIEVMKGRTTKLVGGYFFAQVKIMLLMYVILVIGFLILRVPYSGVIAILVALLDFLPVFGTGTVLVPWGIISLIMGNYFQGIGMFVLYGVTLLGRQLLQPKLVGDAMGLNPLATLFFMYLGFRISGIAGMILAVPVGMIVIELYHIGLFDRFLHNCALLVKGINDFRKEGETEKKENP